MSRYYFDITDGAGTAIDEDGKEFPDFESARAEAMITLGAIAKDVMRGLAGSVSLLITVRDNHTTVLFTARMNIETSTR